MEVRGGDSDFNNRGGRSAAMDPSTATDPRMERGGGQKRQGRSRDDGGGRGAPVARKGAISSSSNWWSARGYEWETHQGNEHRDGGPSPAVDGEATPHVALEGHAASAGPGASPPGFSGGAERDDAGTGTGALALGDEGAVPHAGAPDGNGGPGDRAAGAESTEGDLGKWTGLPGPDPATDHRDPSCPPIAKGTRRRSVVRGPMAPWTATAAGDLFRIMAAPRVTAPARMRMANRSFFYRSAPCASAGVLRRERSRAPAPGTERRTDFLGTTASPAAMVRFGSSWRLIRAHRPRGPTCPQAAGRRARPSQSPAMRVRGGRNATRAAIDPSGLEGSSGTGDGLPSFFRSMRRPQVPPGLVRRSSERRLSTTRPARRRPLPARDLPLFSPADEGPGGGAAKSTEPAPPRLAPAVSPVHMGDGAGRAAPRGRFPSRLHSLRRRHRGRAHG